MYWWVPILTSGITGIVGIAGVLLGSWRNARNTERMNEKNRQHQLEDRARERQHLLADKHQDNLRHAYAEFFAAYRRYLDAARVYVIEGIYHDGVKETAEELARHNEDRTVALAELEKANARMDVLTNQLLDLATTVSEKITNVIVLDNDEAFRRRVEAMEGPGIPRFENGVDAGYVEFKASIAQRADELRDLRNDLKGHFAPKMLSSGASQPKQLTAAEQKLLKR
jgi:hypothetical protein